MWICSRLPACLNIFFSNFPAVKQVQTAGGYHELVALRFCLAQTSVSKIVALKLPLIRARGMSLPSSSFDMPTDGRTDRYFVSFFDKGSGPYAAPHACRAHSHVTPQPFVPQTNILLRFCYPYAFISHVWTPFHGCRANLRSFAF